MSDPRATVVVDGQNAEYLTLLIDNSTITYDATLANGSAQVGLAVKLSAAGTVALATDGSRVLGKLIKVEKDLFATVQVEGGMTLPGGNGASLTLGKAIVGALNGSGAGGYIREVATGTAAELGLCDGKIVDAGTTTAVVVYL
jgi:hypothetical protein